MKSGVRSSSASSAAAPSSTAAMISRSGQSFASLAWSCWRRIGSSSAMMAVGMAVILRRGRLRRGVGDLALAILPADPPPDAQPQQDERREDRRKADYQREHHDHRDAGEHEAQPVEHHHDDREREDHREEADDDAE